MHVTSGWKLEELQLVDAPAAWDAEGDVRAVPPASVLVSLGFCNENTIDHMA